jgi:hypothetical protein
MLRELVPSVAISPIGAMTWLLSERFDPSREASGKGETSRTYGEDSGGSGG